MWSLLARGIYVVEFVVIAVPIAIVLGYFALVLGVVSGGAFLIGVPSLLGGTGTDVQMVVLGAVGVGLAAFGLISFWIFISLSFDYMRGRQEALPQARVRYRRGLFYAAVPMTVLLFLTFSSTDSWQENPFVPFFFIGLVLLVPATHLGLALRARKTVSTVYQPES